MRTGENDDHLTQHDPNYRLAMTIPAHPAAMSRLVDRVCRELEARRWRTDDVMAVELALTEAVANAIVHGSDGDDDKHVECSVACGGVDEVVITIRDAGSGFDPRAVPDPLAPANRAKPGGRGIFLMRSLMDQVVFVNGGREVQMRKRRAPAEAAASPGRSRTADTTRP